MTATITSPPMTLPPSPGAPLPTKACMPPWCGILWPGNLCGPALTTWGSPPPGMGFPPGRSPPWGLRRTAAILGWWRPPASPRTPTGSTAASGTGPQTPCTWSPLGTAGIWPRATRCGYTAMPFRWSCCATASRWAGPCAGITSPRPATGTIPMKPKAWRPAAGPPPVKGQGGCLPPSP